MTLRHDGASELACTALEEAVLFSERAGWPMTIGVEVEISGRLDRARLAAAMAAAARVHPLADARLVPSRPGSMRQRWQLVHATGRAPIVTERQAASADELVRLRSWWVSRPFDLSKSAPVRTLLVRGPGHDHLVLSVHHGAMDGVGALRLLRTVTEAYSSDRTLGPPDDVAERDADVVPGLRDRDPLRSLRSLGSTEAGARLAPGRGAGGRATLGAGHVGAEYVVGHASLAAGWTAGLIEGVTVNDVLLTATARTCAAWNRRHGSIGAAISVSVPVNARPLGTRLEGVANRSLQATVTVPSQDLAFVEQALAGVAAQTVGIRRGDAVEPAARLGGTGWLPFFVRRSIPLVFGLLTRDRYQATTRVSNLGRVGPLSFGPELPVHAVVMSPPVRPPQGLALMALTYNGTLSIGVRACRPLFDEESVDQFLALLVAEIGVVRDVAAADTTAVG